MPYPDYNLYTFNGYITRSSFNQITMVQTFIVQGISSTLHDAGFFVNYPWTSLVNMLDSKPILHISVYDYLWGYEDPLVRLASGVVPNFINFRKFGLLDRVSNNVCLLYKK